MLSDFLESRQGRHWGYDRDDGDFKFYQGDGSSGLEVVVDHGERPTKEFLQKKHTQTDAAGE